MSTTVRVTSKQQSSDTAEIVLKIVGVVALLFVFLVGVKSLEGSFKLLGGGFAKGLINVGSSPILGLFTGMFATVLIQSSSATTSIIVGLVSSGAMSIGGAVPMIMGANLGTSVTNTLVSLGYVNDNKNFRKAFAAATVHDFFNILAVAILLPLEIAFGYLESTATWFANALYGSASSSMAFSSPVKAAIKPFVKGVKSLVIDGFGLNGALAGTVMAIIAGIIIVAALTFIVKITRTLVEENKSSIMEKLLGKNAFVSIIFGALLTFMVQSSSITTSLLVPLAGSGMLTLQAIFPVTVGANIGTTTTALIAALAGNIGGLTIALVHFLFNVTATLIFFAHPGLRDLPVKCAQALAERTARKRVYGFSYIAFTFFIIPGTLSYMFQ